MTKYLDWTGLSHLAEIIKSEISAKAGQEQVDKLETTVGDVGLVLEALTGVSV